MASRTLTTLTSHVTYFQLGEGKVFPEHKGCPRSLASQFVIAWVPQARTPVMPSALEGRLDTGTQQGRG